MHANLTQLFISPSSSAHFLHERLQATAYTAANQRAAHVTSVLSDDLIPRVGWRQIQDGWNHDCFMLNATLKQSPVSELRGIQSHQTRVSWNAEQLYFTV